MVLAQIAPVMRSTSTTQERRTGVRPGLKVVHRHKVGTTVVRRVSELAYIKGRPVALLGWINLGGVRTPLYVCELDPARLHPANRDGVFHYEELTSDPRFPDAIG